ncbi:MAG: hypothetical protein WC491_07580 [Candidatus Omnitrophota bacterium]
MFKWFIQELKKSFCRQNNTDPAIFNDPLALKTGWDPLQFSLLGTKHKLIEVSPARYEFKNTRSVNVGGYVVFVIGMIFMYFFTINISGRYPQVLRLIVSTFAIMLALYIITDIAKILFYMIRGPIVFDKSVGYFWKGRISEAGISDRSGLKDCVELRKIHALQLVIEALAEDNSSYYELNLVLDDASRINAAVYGGVKNTIREDAKKLGQFLNIPVWDTI